MYHRPAICEDVTWLIHVCDMTHWSVWHDSLICVTWLIHMCDVTHAYVWHDAFICVTWLTHTCDMTHKANAKKSTTQVFYVWDERIFETTRKHGWVLIKFVTCWQRVREVEMTLYSSLYLFLPLSSSLYLFIPLYTSLYLFIPSALATCVFSKNAKTWVSKTRIVYIYRRKCEQI